MSISNINNYGTIYENVYASQAKKKVSATEDAKVSEEKTENAGQRKTAMDELTYLSNKYSNYSFVAANYTKGMQYGSSTTVNVAIAPQFLAKMAEDPELEKEYEGYIADMQKLDEQFTQMQAARGWRVVAQGWAIDKDGGMSGWAITTKDPNAKSHLQTMSENAEKIRKQNEEKRKEKAEFEEKRQVSREEKAELKEKMQEAGKAQFGDKFKDVIVIGKDDEGMTISKESGKDNATAAGWNLDIKA